MPPRHAGLTLALGLRHPGITILNLIVMKKIILAALAAVFVAGSAFAANGMVSKTGKAGKVEAKTIAKNLRSDRKSSQKDRTGSKKTSRVTATTKKSPSGKGSTRTKTKVKR
jgi:hypothetical protein